MPGVAIATALMPPLCTAGYGLASGNLLYFFGAFYLIFINSVFISLSTYLIVRFMGYPKKHFLDATQEKRVQTYITIFTTLNLIPSVYLAYGIVKKTNWNEQARQFVAIEMQFPRIQVLNTSYEYTNTSRMIEISLIGDLVSEEEIEVLKNKITAMGLNETELVINQSGSKDTDINVLRNDILKDLYERNEGLIIDKDRKIALLERELSEDAQIRPLSREVANEAVIHHPNLKKFSLGRSIFTDLEKNKTDTLISAYASFQPKPQGAEIKKLQDWLKIRTKSDTVALIID
ncbi:MAG: hypothetical protein C0433_13880 [Cyclobacterium sp.]|nr:hypothetical protein [Cyclobacterium sp.]